MLGILEIPTLSSGWIFEIISEGRPGKFCSEICASRFHAIRKKKSLKPWSNSAQSSDLTMPKILDKVLLLELSAYNAKYYKSIISRVFWLHFKEILFMVLSSITLNFDQFCLTSLSFRKFWTILLLISSPDLFRATTDLNFVPT